MPSFTKLISSITGSSNSSSHGLTSRGSASAQSPLQPSSTFDPKNSRTGGFPSFGGSGSSNNSSVDEYHTAICNKVVAKQPILITVAVESPPITLFGSPAASSGAFFSGTLILDIFMDSPGGKERAERPERPERSERPPASTPQDAAGSLEPMMSVSQLSAAQLKQDYVIVKKVSLHLIQTVKYGKPFVPESSTLQNCAGCTKRVTELAHWDILSKKTAFAKGSSHSCPFSHVIPGSIPPTTILSNFNTSIKYELICLATFVDPKTGKDQLINLAQPIKISRSILREQDRNSTRIFPPTDVTSTAVIPNVVYPRSSFPVEIRMDHVSTPKRRWRMRKLNWRLEECVCVRANHCDSHNEKFSSVYQTMKKQKKSVKPSKNSGGLGHANVNYYFETPKSRLNNNNSSIASSNRTNERDPANPPTDDLFPSTSGSNHGSQPLAPSASNWSVPASPISSNLGSSNTLDQVLSSSISQQQQQQQQQHLSNPDEVVMPNSSSTAAAPKKQTEGIFVEEIRTISAGELKSGWKSDFSGCGRIELVVEVSLMNLISMGINNTIAYKGSINSQTCNLTFNELYEDANSGCNCSIDVDDPELGISVTHNLILELVVAEEMMQSTMASANQSAKARQHQQQTHGHRSGNAGSSISSNSTAAIVTGNMNSQSRMRPVSSSTSDNTSGQTGTRTTLSEEDFPDDRVGPEYATGNKTDVSNHMQGIPTGVARVLRMQFKVILSERSGLGVAWNDEVPPTYHAVGALSPPTYDDSASNVTSPANYGLAVPLEGDERNVNEMANLRL